MLKEKLEDLKIKRQTRGYIGASVLGNPCDRYIWLNKSSDLEYEIDFKKTDIFDIGHQTEAFLLESIKLLEGVEIVDTQTEFNLPHLKGHVDAIIKIDDADLYILEIKSMKKEYFTQVEKKGIQEVYFSYWIQCQIYLYIACEILKQPIKGAIILVRNKNDSSLYQEIITLNLEQAKLFEDKAKRLHDSERMPIGLYSANEMPNFECIRCFFKDFCYTKKVDNSQ
jgi:hypothetical protein